MRQFIVVSIILVLGVAAVSWAGPGVKVTKLWETGPGLMVPESVLYHKPSQTLFVSNINGKPLEKNGKGFISKLSLDGKITSLSWATGLNAPKGSVIYKDSFFVSDIDRLVEIDFKTRKIKAEYPAAGARFLNDVAADAEGNIYVSDYDKETSAIWRLSGGVFSIWLQGPDIREPNGLHMMEKKLIVGNSGDGIIKSIRVADKTIVPFVTVGSGIDGLRPDGKGNFIVSDWAGRTSIAYATGKVDLLMDTRNEKINSADLEYIAEKKMLFIPTFFHNTVAAYRLE